MAVASYHVEVTKSAAKTLRGLPTRDQERIRARLRALANDPTPTSASKLVGVDAWRIRQGDYRIVYTITDSILLVTVIKIDHRSTVYRRR